MNDRTVVLSYPAGRKLVHRDYAYILRGSDVRLLRERVQDARRQFKIVGVEFEGPIDPALWREALASWPQELGIDLRAAKALPYSETLQELSRRRTRVLVPTRARNLVKDVKAWTSMGFPVQIVWDRLPSEPVKTMKSLLDYYLYTPLLGQRVYPFHFLIEQSARKREETLLDYYLLPEHTAYRVDDDLNLAPFVPRPSGPGPGPLPPRAAEILRLARQFQADYYETLARRKSPCVSCPHFRLCGGFFDLLQNKRPCPWPAFFKKLEREVDSLATIFRKERPPAAPAPPAATLFISQACPNNCVFCAAAELRRNPAGDFDRRVDSALDRILQKKVHSISLSGAGEPTLHRRVPELIAKARAGGIRDVVLFTNGYRMTKEKMEAFVDSGLTGFLLSLHGLDESHDRSVNRPGSFKEVLRFLDIWGRDYADKVTLKMNTCLTVFNLDQMDDLARFSAERGVRTHSIVFPEWSGNAVLNPDKIPSYGDVFRRLKKFRADLYPHVVFDNIPDCCIPAGVPLRILEHQGLMVFEDTQQSLVVPKKDGLVPKEKPGLCEELACPRRPTCLGFESRYLHDRPPQELRRDIKRNFRSSRAGA